MTGIASPVDGILRWMMPAGPANAAGPPAAARPQAASVIFVKLRRLIRGIGVSRDGTIIPYHGSRAGNRDHAMPGMYFEEFSVGQVFDHPIRRTITEADNVLFTTMTHNPASLHLDAEYMKGTEFGRPLVNSGLTLGFMVGISVNDTTHGTTVANLGWDEVRFPKPLFHGDTIHVQTEVLELRDSKSRPNNGIVTFAHRAYNQHDELVGVCKRVALMLKKPK
jgi:acyl dehydratase